MHVTIETSQKFLAIAFYTTIYNYQLLSPAQSSGREWSGLMNIPVFVQMFAADSWRGEGMNFS